MEGLIKKQDQAVAIAAGLLEASTHEGTTTKKPKPAYSQKSVEDMQAIRLAAVQTAMLDKPEFVLDLLAFALSPASGYRTSVMGVRFDEERNAP